MNFCQLLLENLSILLSLKCFATNCPMCFITLLIFQRRKCLWSLKPQPCFDSLKYQFANFTPWTMMDALFYFSWQQSTWDANKTASSCITLYNLVTCKLQQMAMSNMHKLFKWSAMQDFLLPLDYKVPQNINGASTSSSSPSPFMTILSLHSPSSPL